MTGKITNHAQNQKGWIILKLVILLVFLTSLSAAALIYFRDLLTDPFAFREFITGFGAGGPVVYIIIASLQVIVAPIPGQVMGIASGFLFGTVLGTIYSIIGLGIGSYIAFVLSRRYGRPFVERVVPKKNLKRLDSAVEKGGAATIFLIFLLPGLPDDAVCFICGLTRIRIRILVILSVAGRLPGFIVLNLVGDGIASQDSIASIIVFAVMMIISGILYVFRERIEKILLVLISKVKRMLSR
jgi:uncharacterized membrane protein YdjX (TVP38/TMEM64 family)